MCAKISLEHHYNEGILHYEKGQYDLAIECFKKAIKNDSANHRYHYNLGLAYVKKEEYDLAINSFKEAVSINPNDADIFHNLGIAYSKKREFNKAIQMYKKALLINPNDPDSYDNLGIAYFSLKHYDEAILNFRKSLDLNSENSSVAYNLAYAYYVNKQYDLAKESFLYVISINNDDIEAHFNLGKIYLKQNQQALAINSFEKTLALNPDHKGAKDALNKINNEKENIVNIEPTTLAVAKVEPVKSKSVKVKEEEQTQNLEVAIDKYFVNALNYLKNKELEFAVEELKKVLILKNDYPKANEIFQKVTDLINQAESLFNEGLHYYSNNNYVKALSCFNKALSIKPNDNKINDMLNKTIENRKILLEKEKVTYQKYINDEQYDLAIKSLKKAIAENPLEPENHLILGKVYIKQKEYHNAIDCLRETLNLDPDNKEAKKILFEVIQTMNTYKDDIKDYFKLAIIYTNKKDYVNALNVLGKVLQAKNDDRDAKALLVKVMALINETSSNYNYNDVDNDIIQEIVKCKDQLHKTPNNYDVYYKLGVIYGKLQKYTVAINCYRKVLRLKPDHEEAKKSLYSLMKIMNS